MATRAMASGTPTREVTHGCGTHDIDFERYTLEPGMVVFRPELLREAVPLEPCARLAPARDEIFERFRAAVEREFRRAHEVAAYAAILRCSPRTLTRHCLDAVGRSAKRVIEDRVLLEARRSLAHEPITVAALAAQLGFSEATQLVKFFRRVSGETPGAFRERIARPAPAR